jgi:hypothetical protein
VGSNRSSWLLNWALANNPFPALSKAKPLREDKLQQIAQVLGVTPDAIKNFSEEAVINIISSTLHDNAGSVNNNCTLNFNPMDKLLEVMEENKKLYERLLQAEKDKNELLKENK